VTASRPRQITIPPARPAPPQFATVTVFPSENFRFDYDYRRPGIYPGFSLAKGRTATEPDEPGPFGANGFTLGVIGGFR